MIIADSGADTEFTGRHPAPCSYAMQMFTQANPLSGGDFFMQKKARVGSGNSMRYLHCHFYRVDFNQGL